MHKVAQSQNFSLDSMLMSNSNQGSQASYAIREANEMPHLAPKGKAKNYK